MQQNRVDYVFDGHGEFCNFVYCLLMKTRVLSDLPDFHAWDACMDIMKYRDFVVVPSDVFLANYDLGKQLFGEKTKEITEYCLHCRQFIDRLIIVLLESSCARSVIAKGIYSFC